MRCRAGDLAVITSSYVLSNVDKLVTCVRLLPLVERDGVRGYEMAGPGLFPANQFVGPVWEVESLGSDLTVVDITTQKRTGVRRITVADKDLRPLRDNDGQDETLRNMEMIV
jgi:hypothetical protein